MPRPGAALNTALVLLLLLVPPRPTPAAAQSGSFEPGWYAVTRVVDGDTLRIRGLSRSVRFAGVASPELGTDCGDAAAAYLDGRLGPGSAVYLEPAEWDYDAQTNRYRAYVRVEHRGGLWMLQELLLMEGLAKMDRRARYASEWYLGWFEAAEGVAQDADLGIWGDGCAAGGGRLRTDPFGWECPDSHPIKGDAASGLYHLPGGDRHDAIRPDACFATEAAARAWDYRRSPR